MRRILSHAMVLPLLLAASVPASGAKPPDTWEGLLRIGSTKMDAVYLLPGADFRTYTKVMLDPTEIAFRKNWQRDQNSAQRDTDAWVSNSEAREMLERAKTGFDKVFARPVAAAGLWRSHRWRQAHSASASARISARTGRLSSPSSSPASARRSNQRASLMRRSTSSSPTRRSSGRRAAAGL